MCKHRPVLSYLIAYFLYANIVAKICAKHTTTTTCHSILFYANFVAEIGANIELYKLSDSILFVCKYCGRNMCKTYTYYNTS